MTIVACIGDSETWCYGLNRDEAWPYRLCIALDGGGTPSLDALPAWSGTLSTTASQREHVGTDWTVWNLGISGDTSRGMRSRWATDMLGQGSTPDYAIIMVGENDIYYAAPSGGNDPTYDLDYASTGLKANVEWMVASCLANGIVPILATPTPHGTLESASDRWTRMQDWLKWLGTSMSWMSTSESANTLGCALSDHYQAVYDGVAHPAYPVAYPTGSTYSLDNIHPNAAGAQVIADTAAATITAILPVQVGRSLAIPYSLHESVGRSLAVAYGVTGPVGRSVNLTYVVNAPVGRSLAIPYGVETTAYRTMRLLIPAGASYSTRRTLLDTLTPTGPFTATGSSRSRYSATGSSRNHADLTGGPTP